MRFEATALAVAVFAGQMAMQPLSAGQVDRAIKDGVSGKKLEATCSATAPFDVTEDPDESHTVATLVIEGPTGRIMHAARTAKSRHEPFTALQVTDDMRAPTARITATLEEFGPPARVDPYGLRPPLRDWQPSPITAIEVRQAGRVWPALSRRTETMSSTELGESATAEIEDFDLAAFRSQQEVTIAVASAAVTRTCKLAAKPQAGIR